MRDALLYSQDEHERCDRALLRIADEQAAWRGCLALAAIGFAFQRIADRGQARKAIVANLWRDRKLVVTFWNDIDEALGLADQEYVSPPARDLIGEPTT